MSRLEQFLVLILIVFLPSQLAFHWWPSWSLVSGVRVDYLAPTVYFTDLIIIPLLILGIAKKIIKVPKIFYLILLGAGINIYFAYSPVVAVYHWLRFVELFILGVYFYYRSQKLKTVIAAGLLLAMFWSSVLAIWQIFLQRSVGGPWVWLGERLFSITTPGIAKLDLGNFGYHLRPYATLPHPNALAGFILLGTLLFLHFHPKPPKALLLLWLPIILALILSWSRSVFFAILALIFPWVLPLVFLLPGNPTSFSERWQLLVLAFHSIQQHPWFGVGLGNFIPSLRGSVYQPVHNLVALLGSELGIGFLVAIGWYVVKAIVGLFQQKQWLLLKTFIVVLGLGMVDHYWLTLQQTALLLTILLAQIKLKSKNL